MKQVIKNVVIVGGGTAGWLTAALLQKVVGTSINITLVESEAIGTVGVGEATIPPIRLVNQVLGINEAEFLRETKATIKLAIKFENWRTPNESYFHTFGSPGKSMAFCHFHHFVNRAKNLGHESTIWDYDLNYLCATQGKFAHIKAQDPVLDLPYAYHFDASLYAQFLRRYCQKLGAKRIEGMIESVQQHPSGDIAGVTLQDGQQIHGDLFVDCSGFRGLLIQQTLGVGYDDWTHLLPCDRAVAVPSERFDNTVPYTRAIAHKAGWQWRIPLQHRNGNGLVYCSSHMSDDEATHSLLNNLDSTPIGEPKVIHFKTGRRRKQWHKNVVAVGLASGFLEPLESTSIHLIQSAIVRLIHLFPHQGIDSAAVDEFNHQSELEYTQIRDFLVLHYHLTERDDSQFWRNMQSMDIPASLAHKMALFKQTGKLFREQNDLFLESSWLQVMVGQGIEPNDYHPIANNLSEPQLLNMLNKMCEVKQEPLTSLPSHDEFLKHFCKVT